MSEIQRLERVVNAVLGKPVALLVYVLWLTTKLGCRGEHCGSEIGCTIDT